MYKRFLQQANTVVVKNTNSQYHSKQLLKLPMQSELVGDVQSNAVQGKCSAVKFFDQLDLRLSQGSALSQGSSLADSCQYSSRHNTVVGNIVVTNTVVVNIVVSDYQSPIQ